MLAPAFLSVVRSNAIAGGALKKMNDLIPLTEPQVRRLLIQIAWPQMNFTERILAWSAWRRRHQAVARHCHYRTHTVETQL